MQTLMLPGVHACRVLCALLLAQLVTVEPAVAQTQTADYELVFDATWSSTTHPVDFPTGAHFSPLVGGTHGPNAVFWEPGGLASDGIERMAELGRTIPLLAEFDQEIADGFADQSFVGAGIDSPGATSIFITVDQAYSRLTLVTMVALSPDWFLGVHGLELFDQGWWVTERVVDLFAYDAGTDDGVTYGSLDADSDPAQPISLLTSPVEPGVPLGTLTLRRLPEPGLGPSLGLGGSLLLAWRRRARRH
jgi:hypothetical protein